MTMNMKAILSGDDREACPACMEKASELMIRRIEVKDGAIEIDAAIARDVLVVFAASALKMLDTATNYVEMQMAVPELAHETVTVVVQRHLGKTPHEMREQAEKERDELKLGLTDKNIADIRESTARMLKSLEGRTSGTAEGSRKLLHTFDLITKQLVEALGHAERRDHVLDEIDRLLSKYDTAHIDGVALYNDIHGVLSAARKP